MNENQEVVPAVSQALSPFEEMKEAARVYSKASIIPASLKGKPEDIFIILQTAKELGIGPMQGLTGVNVIQGKPSISPELQLGLIKSKCPEAFIQIKTDEKAKSVTVTMAPSRNRMDEAFSTTWDMERAKAMGLSGKDNYLKQPMVMLRWRAVGEAARFVFPHVSRGLLNSEEAVFEHAPVSSGPSLKALFSKAPVQEAEIALPSSEGLEIER